MASAAKVLDLHLKLEAASLHAVDITKLSAGYYTLVYQAKGMEIREEIYQVLIPKIKNMRRIGLGLFIIGITFAKAYGQEDYGPVNAGRQTI